MFRSCHGLLLHAYVITRPTHRFHYRYDRTYSYARTLTELENLKERRGGTPQWLQKRASTVSTAQSHTASKIPAASAHNSRHARPRASQSLKQNKISLEYKVNRTLRAIPKPHPKDQMGLKMFAQACEEGDFRIVRFLCEDRRCRFWLELLARLQRRRESLRRTPTCTPVCLRNFQDTIHAMNDRTRVSLVSGLKLKHGGTALHIACRYGHHRIVEYLVEQTSDIVDVNVLDRKGRTPLHMACRNGYKEVVIYLLESDALQGAADMSILDKFGLSVLVSACKCANRPWMDVVKYLAETHGDKFDYNLRVNERRTILHTACSRGHLELVQYLVESGRVDDSLKLRCNQDKTPLHLACENGHVDVVEYLLKLDPAQVDVNDQDKKGCTPFHLACGKSKSKGNTSKDDNQYDGIGQYHVITYMIETEHGNIDLTKQNQDGDTGLHLACRLGHRFSITESSTTTHLYKHLRNVVVPNRKLQEVSADDGDAEIDHLLHLAAPLLDIQNRQGNTPLHEACLNNNIDIVFALIGSMNVNATVQNNEGDTVLHIACKAAKLSVVMTLTLFDNVLTDLNIQNEAGNTVLIEAVRKGHLKSVEYLARRKSIDPNVKNKYGQTALHVACQCGNVDTVFTLLKSGLNFDFDTLNHHDISPADCGNANGGADNTASLSEERLRQVLCNNGESEQACEKRLQ